MLFLIWSLFRWSPLKRIFNISLCILKEKWAVAEDVDDGFEVFIADLGIFRDVGRINLDVGNELYQKFEGELVPFFSNLYKEVPFWDDAATVSRFVTVKEGLPERIKMDVVYLVSTKIFTTISVSVKEVILHAILIVMDSVSSSKRLNK